MRSIPLFIAVLLLVLSSLSAKNVDHVAQRNSLLQEISLLKDKANYDQALSQALKARTLTEQNRDHQGLASVWNLLGSIYQLQGNISAASDAFQQSLTLSKEIKYQKGTADALLSIAELHKLQGSYDEALQNTEQAIMTYQSLQDNRGLAEAYHNMADIYDRQNDLKKALELYEKALKIRKSIGDPVEVAKTYVDITNVLGRQHRLDLAFEYLQKAASVFEAAGQKERLASVLNRIANIYIGRGNYRLALEQHLKSLALNKEIGSKRGIAFSKINIGVIHEAQGSYDLAMENYREALQLLEELKMKPVTLIAYSNIAGIYALQGKYKDSMSYYGKSLSLSREIADTRAIAELMAAMGQVYELMENYEQALPYYQESLKDPNLFDDWRKIIHQLGLARVQCSLNKLKEGLDVSQGAYNLAREVGMQDLLWKARFEEGRCLLKLEENAKARDAFKEAVAIVESQRADVAGAETEQQQFFELRTDPYAALIALLVQENDIPEAFQYAERAKARVLLDVLQIGKNDITKGISAGEKEEEQTLRAELVSMNAELQEVKMAPKPDQHRIQDLEEERRKARLRFESFRTNLYAKHPELKLKRGEVPSINISQIGTLIQPSEALLEYVVTREKTFLFVITRPEKDQTADIHVYSINIGQKELAATTEKFRQQLALRDPRFGTIAKELYTQLLGPAQKHLENKRLLIIVPDRELWELPFQALLSPGGAYLVQQAAVSYAPSVAVLKEMVRADKNMDRAARLLALGNPKLNAATIAGVKRGQRDEKLEPLPEAEEEVKALQALYRSPSTRVFTGASAHETAFKSEAAGADVIHIAAHGVLSDANPLYSHLVLSRGSEQEDGLLEPWEVMNMDLNASLVVLSACETGRGKVGAGEGLIGFSWAFFVAGAPSSVVSQWKVDSQSTTLLMREFHRNLKRSSSSDRLSRAEALRRAAIKLLQDKRYLHPYYWAGFVLIGDPS